MYEQIDVDNWDALRSGFEEHADKLNAQLAGYRGSMTLLDHGVRDGAPGPEGVRQAIRWAHDTFAERRIVPEDIIASGDRVVARIRVSAIPVGDLCGIAACRLVEHWMVRDDLTALRQLGGAEGREP